MADIIDIDDGDQKRRALRELKYFGNMLKGVMAWVEEADETLDAEKAEKELRARVEALKAEEAKLKDVKAELAKASAELARVNSEISAARAKFA